jgi:hypothetical protein
MGKFDYPDPGTDSAYCDNHSEPPVEFNCSWCGKTETDDTYWPYCDPRCAMRAEQDDELEKAG